MAWLLGRDTDALTALSVAAVAIVLVDPAALSDVGFQLSFAGTLGLVAIAPGLTEWLMSRARFPRLAAEPLAVTATASLMVTPVIAHTFERLQLAAIPANLLALAAPVWIMATGAPVAVWAAAGWPFGEVLAWAAWLPLEYLIRAARLAAALPGASIPIPGFGLEHAAAVYAAIALLVALGGRQPWRIPQARTRRVRSLAVGLGVAAFALPPVLALVAAPRLFHDPGNPPHGSTSPASTPTVYALRMPMQSLVVAGDRLRPYVLDAALPDLGPDDRRTGHAQIRRTRQRRGPRPPVRATHSTGGGPAAARAWRGARF